MRINSIRFKANILFSLILAVILTVFGIILYYEAKILFYRDFDESLSVKAREVSVILNAYYQAQWLDHHETFIQGLFGDERLLQSKKIIDDLWHSQVRTLNLKNDYIHILSARGKLVLSSQNVTPIEEKIFAEKLPFAVDQIIFRDLKNQSFHIRAINFPVLYNNRLLFVVQIGTPLTSVLSLLNKLKVYIFLSILIILIFTSLMGGLFASRVLRPVNEITKTAEGLSYKDLHRRISAQHSDEEIVRLIDSFNTMLGRLEESFGHVNEFSSHVAHELKTPLAILRGEMELALSQRRSPDEYKKVLENGMEEVNRLIKIIKDLLLLANLDYRMDVFNFEKFDLTEFMKEIVENSKMLAAEKDIVVTFDRFQSEIMIEGDRVHLRRLFFNLVNNAVKFTPKGGKIHIDLKAERKEAVVSIRDTGVGIAEEDLKRLFTKFFRVKKVQGTEPSSGLGLNIAMAIAKAHRGKISVQSDLGKGSVFIVSLPVG